MIKLTDLLKEIQEERRSIVEIEELLGRPLTEAELEELNLKRTARNLAAGVALTAATLGGGNKAKAATTPSRDSAATTQTVTKTQSSISSQEKKAWNTFHEWLESKGYAGNDKMNNDAFREKVLNQYKKETGVNAPDTNFVKKIQQYQIDSRNDIIKSVEAGKASVEYNYKTKGWDGFQPEVLSMEKRGGVDGKIGEETSKYFFRVWKDRETGKLTKTFTIPGEIGKAK
jgi:hypothetical protein